MKQNWEIKKLGEVCEKKQNIKWKDESEESFYHYIDLTSVNRDTNLIEETQIINTLNAPSRAQQIVKESDIIFGTTRPTLKRVCIIPSLYDNQICSTGFCILRANKNLVTPNWIYHTLLSDDFYKYIGPLQRGANYPAVTDSDVMNYAIPVPPLSEQHRIVSILDEKFSQIETLKSNAQKNLDNAEQLWKAQMEKQFDNQKWEKKKLGEVCDSFEYGTSKKSCEEGNVPVLRMGNIQNRELDYTDLVYSNDAKDIEKYMLHKGDVLFNRTNSPEWVGKTAIFRENFPAIFAGYIIRVNYKRDFLNGEFLNYWLNADSTMQYGYSIMTSSVHQANISGSKLSEYIIPIPPLAEQERIVKELDALSAKINTLKANYRRQIECCDELRQSLLKKAFEGEL